MHAIPPVSAATVARRASSRRVPDAVYRRRRVTAALVVATVAAMLAALIDTAAGGSVGRAVFERVVAVGVVVVWARCAVALLRWHRADRALIGRSDAESGVSCLTPGSVPIVGAQRAA